ncbi:winged helix-turn-helix transcriptional regulator [Rhizobium panacihumi]|uniref:winged helix-turn-helix transcriptional regulator n=1 Tax=Rhizobium panacihumi TaxID=2008450 RepID=UPI003D7B3D66
MLSLSAAKWSLPVLEAIEEGTLRFNALQRKIDGISHRLLTVTLRRLIAEGLLLRHEYDESILHVEYNLTPAGRDLLETAHQFCTWTSLHPPR